MCQRARHYWVPPVVCSGFFPDLTERWAGRIGRWQGLSIFLSPFPFISLPLPLWTEARVHLGLLYCATGKLPIRAILWLNTESRGFIKKLICYSLPLTRCFSISHTLPFFHWLTLPHSSFLSWAFLKLSLYCVHSFLLCCTPLPSWGLPWLG